MRLRPAQGADDLEAPRHLAEGARNAFAVGLRYEAPIDDHDPAAGEARRGEDPQPGPDASGRNADGAA